MHTNQRLLVEELLGRGAAVEVVDARIELVRVSYGGRAESMIDRFPPSVPYAPVRMSADKHLSKRLLHAAGLVVPEGILVLSSEPAAALRSVEEAGLTWPLAAKPNWGTHGDDVRLFLEDEDALAAALDAMTASRGPCDAVIERCLLGREMRAFVTAAGGFALLEREPASVVGDGRLSVGALAQRESSRRVAEKAAGRCALCPIALDAEAERFLARFDLNLSSVPVAGDRVQIRASSNLSKGGRSIDRTDVAHPAWRAVAARALAVFPGLPLAGFDILMSDPAQPPGSGGWAILEANSNPGVAMHMQPDEGLARNVAASRLPTKPPLTAPYSAWANEYPRVLSWSLSARA